MSSSRDHEQAASGASLSDLKPSEVLSRAADLIEPKGKWTQRAFARDHNGDDIEDSDPRDFEPACFCLFGAINVASGRPADTEHYPYKPEPADLYVRRAVGVGFDLPITRLSEWNDSPERTQAEVVAALRKAAELARADEAKDDATDPVSRSGRTSK